MQSGLLGYLRSHRYQLRIGRKGAILTASIGAGTATCLGPCADNIYFLAPPGIALFNQYPESSHLAGNCLFNISDDYLTGAVYFPFSYILPDYEGEFS